MNGTNEKLLKQLYGIRAGLSVIADKQDEVKKRKTESNLINNEFSCIDAIVQNEKKIHDNQIKALQQKIDKCVTPPAYSFWDDFLFPLLVHLLPLLLWTLMVASFLGGFFIFKTDIIDKIPEFPFSPLLVGLCYILTFLLCAIPIGFLIFAIVEAISDQEFSTFLYLGLEDFFPASEFRSRSDIKQQTRFVQLEKQGYQKQLSNLRKEQARQIEKIKNDYDQKKQSLEVRLQTTQRALIEQTKTSSLVLQTLRKAYTPILDERDWKHLDLIIYYLETGRADTTKEALQLVDRQVQTDTIVRTMQQATKTITESIQLNTNKMMQVIHESTTLLSTQLGNIQASINTTILQNNRIIEQNNSALEQSKRVETAFKKYATTSSESLYAIALNAEQEMRNRRNNLA